MSRRSKRPGIPDWIALLREAHDLSERVLAAEHDKVIGAIGRVYLAAARELLAGTISELELERPTNAIRLARHLFEFELEFFYIADRPVIRIPQFFAESAQRGLNIEDRVAGVTLPATAKRQMKARVAKAKKAAAERAELAALAGNKDIPEPWGMPSRKTMQEFAEVESPIVRRTTTCFTPTQAHCRTRARSAWPPTLRIWVGLSGSGRMGPTRSEPGRLARWPRSASLI